MKALKDLPIGAKLGMVVRFSVLIALGVALLTIFMLEVRGELRRADDDARTLSEIVADSAISPLRFDDPRVADSLLASLRYHERVSAAMLLRPDGAVFATYPVALRAQPDQIARLKTIGAGKSSRWSMLSLVVSQRLVSDGEEQGCLILEFNLQPILGRLALWIGFAFLGLLVALLAAALFVRRVQGMIVDPIQQLGPGGPRGGRPEALRPAGAGRLCGRSGRAHRRFQRHAGRDCDPRPGAHPAPGAPRLGGGCPYRRAAGGQGAG